MAFDSARGKTVLFGGQDSSDTFLDETWEWDGTRWTHQTPPSGPSARAGHAMVFDGAHGKTVLFGGQNGSTILGDTWEWDGTHWAQRMPALSPPAHTGQAMAYDSTRGRTLLFDFNGTWEWDGSNWAPVPLASSPPDPSVFGLMQSDWILPGLVYDSARGRSVLFGAGGTWEYVGR